MTELEVYDKCIELTRKAEAIWNKPKVDVVDYILALDLEKRALRLKLDHLTHEKDVLSQYLYQKGAFEHD